MEIIIDLTLYIKMKHNICYYQLLSIIYVIFKALFCYIVINYFIYKII